MDDALPPASLPDDVAALKAIVSTLARQRDEARRQLEQARHQAQALELAKLRLEVELLRLKKWYYGPRADRLGTGGEVAQMLLEFAGDLEARPLDPQDLGEQADAADARSARRVRRGRRDLAAFENLPATRHVHDLAEHEKPCPCCGEERQVIGQESSWQLEYVPGRFERIEHVRFKYACRRCDHNGDGGQVALAEKPSQPIEKGMAGPGLLAYVITSKFADYLPLYRLEAIFARSGFAVDRATQCLWCRDAAEIIKPLYDLMTRRVLQSHVIATDDTLMPMLAPGHGKARPARMWVYVGDESNPYNVFDFTPGRSRDGPATFLKDYKQILLADAYGGYDGVVVGNDITRAGCWAHARRKFVDAEKAHPAIAAEAVTLIKRLYDTERRGASLAAAARLDLRRAESAPVLSLLKDRLHAWRDRLLPKHPMAQAVNYALNQWAELSVFAADGAVPIDNNLSEREMKRIVLNRKNSLFVGNERGGRTAAVLSSLTSTSRRHGVDPQRYLTQLLANLPATPISQLDRWLPDRWKQVNQARLAP
jgi:transposase